MVGRKADDMLWAMRVLGDGQMFAAQSIVACPRLDNVGTRWFAPAPVGHRMYAMNRRTYGAQLPL